MSGRSTLYHLSIVQTVEKLATKFGAELSPSSGYFFDG